MGREVSRWVGCKFGAGGGEARGRGRKLFVFDCGAIASHEDGVHHGQGAADAEDEAEEDTDERAGKEVHEGNGMLRARPGSFDSC